jgi:heme oxygenase
MLAMPVMSRLHTATCDLDRRVQDAVEVLSPGVATERFRLYLARMYGFHAPLERRLTQRIDLSRALPDLPARQKTELIAADLVALGVAAEDVVDLPRCTDLPEIPDVAAALGCLYVLEHAAIAARSVRGALPEDLAAGSRYLAHAPEHDVRSQSFAEAVEQHARVHAIADRVVAGALGTLTHLVRWLSPASGGARA